MRNVGGVSEQSIGRPRGVVADLPSYRPGKGASQAEEEHGIDAGYTSGDLVFNADRWNGAANNGEFEVLGTSFTVG